MDEGLVFAVPELSGDAEARQRAANFIGAVAAGAWRETMPQSDAEEAIKIKPLESLYDAIKRAAAGNETAYKMVETNVATDVIERTIKAGHIISVDLMVDEAGTIQQHGQSMESVHANSLRFASGNQQMRERTEAETRNAFRIKDFYDQGKLNDYRFVVFSRAADNMSLSDMREAGFFTDTMSCAVQVTSAEDCRLVTESAFVAGKANPEAARHDKATLKALFARLGVDIAAKDATALLDTPLLIHKDLLPDGALNLVEMYDEAAGDTFFGEAKPRQNYQAYKLKCQEREVGFKPKIDAIVSELIAEADTISSRVMAAERLHKLSGKHMIELAGQDFSIDPRVFGDEAAVRIEAARWHYEQGNIQLARQSLQEAVKYDQSSSCPSSLKNKSAGGGLNDAENTGGNKEDDDADCDFVSKECPLCRKKDVKTVVKKEGGKKVIRGDCGCKKDL